MDNRDVLQMEIDKARSNLTLESREAIDAVDWKSIVAGMGKKYTPDQLENLETETELLLCGLLSPEYYVKELETRMKLPKSEIDILIGEMDKLIFKKIQSVLIKGVKEKEPVVFDPRFKTLPQDIQSAIAKSNWQNKLYKIGEKNKLPIDKMAFLEESTVKVIGGVISPTVYESNLFESFSKLSKDEIKEIIAEVNTNIMKSIRSIEQRDQINTSKKGQEDEGDVPLPPYKTESTPISVATQAPKTESGIYKNAGIEMVIKKDQPAPIAGTDEVKTSAKDDISFMKSGVQIIADKLLMPTSSSSIVSDHSLPKIGQKEESKDQLATPSASTIVHDQYHEAIE